MISLLTIVPLPTELFLFNCRVTFLFSSFIFKVRFEPSNEDNDLSVLFILYYFSMNYLDFWVILGRIIAKKKEKLEKRSGRVGSVVWGEHFPLGKKGSRRWGIRLFL
jgi:hypothetical protein